MKSLNPVNLEAMTEDADSAKHIASQQNYGFGMFRVATYLLALAVAALGVLGCNDGGDNDSNHIYPSAEIMLNPSSAPKPYNGNIECDASGSIPGDWPITEVRFDFNNDGIDDYVETEASAPDGVFDGKTMMPADYPTQGDYPVTATIMDAAGNESSATADFGVGFGADITGAEDYIYNAFDSLSYDASYSVPFQAWDPVEMKMVDFMANVEGILDFGLPTQQSTFVIYDSGNLTQEQLDCLANRESLDPPYDEPRIRVVEPDYSPLTIDDVIFN